MIELYDRWNGLIPLLGGTYALLIANGFVQPDIADNWERAFGKAPKIVAPLLILFGIIKLTLALAR